jgi:hypothetical protein
MYAFCCDILNFKYNMTRYILKNTLNHKSQEVERKVKLIAQMTHILHLIIDSLLSMKMSEFFLL